MRKPRLDPKEFPPIEPEDRYKPIRECLRAWIFSGANWSDLAVAGLDPATVARIAKWPHKTGTKTPKQNTLDALNKAKNLIPGFPSIRLEIEAEKKESTENSDLMRFISRSFNHYEIVYKLIQAIVKLDNFNDLDALKLCLYQIEHETRRSEQLAEMRKKNHGPEEYKRPDSDRDANNG